MGRWDWLEGVKAKELPDAIAEEAAKLIAGELRRFPPEVEWSDELARERFAPLYAEDAPPPSIEARRAGFQLARWELDREYDAIAFHHRSAQLRDHDRLAADLLSLYLSEVLLILSEKTQGKIRRHHLREALDLAERLLAAS